MSEKISIMAYINIFSGEVCRYMLNSYELNGDIYTLHTRDGYIFEADKSNVVIRLFYYESSLGD